MQRSLTQPVFFYQLLKYGFSFEYISWVFAAATVIQPRHRESQYHILTAINHTKDEYWKRICNPSVDWNMFTWESIQ